MCSREFLNKITICSWNINGVKEKFLSSDVTNLFSSHDILIISESHFGVRHKTPKNFEFVTRSKPLNYKNLRGGVIVYKKADSALKLNVLCDNLDDLVIVELDGSSLIIIAIYIPPGNSIYYSDKYFDQLNLVISSFIKYRTILVVGDINARIANRFPTKGINYKMNPDTVINAHGGRLMNILKEHDILVINGIDDRNKSFDSKFTFIRKSGTSQVDLALCNHLNCIQDFKIAEKISQSDHCALLIDLDVKISPSIDIVNECATGILNYNQYDPSRKIKNPINIKKLNMLTLHNKLTNLGNILSAKYGDIIPTQASVNEFANDLTNGVYDCCQESKISFTPNTRAPHQQNCTSDNFKAIAEAHKYCYENVLDQQRSEYHKQEWLFYQTVAWEKEQEEVNATKNTKWKMYNKEPKKLWKMIDYKGETQSNTKCPAKVVSNYFSKNIFNSIKVTDNPTLTEMNAEIHEYDCTNDVTDRDFTSEELSTAIKRYGKGISFDGLSGKILHILPENLYEIVLRLYQMSYTTFYPTSWQSQLLSPIEKKGHTIISPKLRGIAVGPMFSRLYDIMINSRFTDWYTPNPHQAGGERKGQGCIIQIFGLFIMLDMAEHCGKKLFIGLLDFEKAFDYMNRPRLMKDMMKDGIGSTFLRNLNNMYSEIRYLPKLSLNQMDDPIISEHGVTQGRASSGNLFSYYISDMSKPMDEKSYSDFMIANLLQLADDSIVLADNLKSLSLKLTDVLKYCQDKLTIVNMDKTNYMEFSDEPSLVSIEVEDQIIKPVDPKKGYVWLGFNLSYSSKICKLVHHHIKKKKSNEAKFYAW